MPGILREDENQLPRGVTTGTGKYTAGTPITSRSAPRAPAIQRVDFSSTPRLKQAAGVLASVGTGGGSAAPGLIAPPVPSQAGKPGISIIPAAEARTVTTQPRAAGPQRPTTPGFAASHFSANQPSGAPATALPGVRENQNVYDIAGINRYDDASGVPTFTNKGRAGYDEMQGMVAPALPGATPASPTTTGLPQISQQSLERTLATSPLFANRSADGVSRIDPDSAALARKGFAADQATAEAEANAANAERRILKRLPRLPAAQQPAALTALTASQTARKGKPLSLDQYRAQQAPQLLAGGEPTAGQNLLFGKRAPALGRPQLIQMDGPEGEDGFPGPKELYSVDPVTGQGMPVALPGRAGQGRQGQGAGVPQDGTYDVPGKGRITVRGGRAYDASGAEVL